MGSILVRIENFVDSFVDFLKKILAEWTYLAIIYWSYPGIFISLLLLHSCYFGGSFEISGPSSGERWV
jgi:hypothetical protein